MLEKSFVIAAISCNKDVLGTLRGCVLFFKRKSYKNESYFNNRRFTHCQLDTRSILALRFSKPAQLFWNKGVLRLDESLSAHCLPIKNQNCQERRLQVEHFTPSIPDAKYRLRKHGCAQEGKFRYFGLKSRGYFTYRFLSSPPVLFLYSRSVFWSWVFTRPHFRG